MAEVEDHYTLLCVRADGVASVMDVTPASEFAQLRQRAQAMLREHRSCRKVEVWRGGALLEEIVL